MARIAPVPQSKARPIAKLAYVYSKRRFGRMPEPFAVAAHAPKVFWAMAWHESRVDRTWRSVDRDLRELAVLKAALTIECPWCVDFGSMLSDLPEEKLAALPDWRRSDVFDARERAVLDYAEAMSETPVRVTDEMVEELRRHLSDEQVVELTAFIALENTRARNNAALGIEPQGYSTGACTVPEREALRR